MRTLNVRNAQFALVKGMQDPDLATETENAVIHVHENQAAEYVIRNVTGYYNLLLKALKPFKPNVVLDIHIERPVCIVEVEEVLAVAVGETPGQGEEGRPTPPSTGEVTPDETRVEVEGEAVSGQEVAGVETDHAQAVDEERAQTLAKRERRRAEYEATIKAREDAEQAQAEHAD